MEKEEIYLPVPIDIYKDRYSVSNLGNVKSIKRNIIIKPYKLNGYYEVGLWYKSKRSTFTIHKLVALTFVENANNLLVKNHINGNKLDNNASNLEWCTYQENNIHSQKVLGKVKPAKVVNKLDLNGNFIKSYASAKLAADELNISVSTCRNICNQRKIRNGFRWEYAIDYRTVAPNGKSLEEYSKYIITSDGKVYSNHTKKYMVLRITEEGYITVGLFNNKLKKQKHYYVHVLVAKLYVDLIDGKDSVNHKDFNKANNDYTNLEWVTQSENAQHYQDAKFKQLQDLDRIKFEKQDKKIIEFEILDKSTKHGEKAVIMCDLNGNELKKYNSATIAAKEHNIDRSFLSKACKGKYKSAAGYSWKYEDISDKTIYNNLPKSIIMCDLNGNEIKKYPSILSAVKDNTIIKLHHVGITRVCNGKTQSYKGYTWKYG